MEISNTQDIIDSRDVIERIEELENEIENLIEEATESEENYEDDEEYWELKEELDTLLDLQEQCNYGDWKYGEALIHEDYFVEYVEDMLKDIGYLPNDVPWFIEIDWDKTAENIKMDYTEVNFDGETYYIRS